LGQIEEKHNLSTEWAVMIIIRWIKYILTGLTVLPFFIAWVINIDSAFTKIGGIDIGMGWPKKNIFLDLLPDALLDLITVDLSSVTTFLIMLTYLFIISGINKLYQVKTGKRSLDKSSIEHFPFWDSYRTTFVQLGLVGTLFAFIIAFGSAKILTASDNHKPVQLEQKWFSDSDSNIRTSSESPNDTIPADITKTPISDTSVNVGKSSTSASIILLDALGTALWSTFSAILLAFILCPIIEMAFRNRIKKISPLIDPDGSNEQIDQDISTVSMSFKELCNSVLEADSAFQQLQQELIRLGGIDKLTRFVAETTNHLSILNTKLHQITDDVGNIQRRLDAFQSGYYRLGEEQENLKRTHQILVEDQKNSNANTSKISEEIMRKVSKIDDRLSALEEIKSKYKKLKKTISVIKEALRSKD
jgi:gas vesicle protein